MDFKKIKTMKLIISTSIFLLISISAFSQSSNGNLTYSRVITVTFTPNSANYSSYDTVPVGKVWKMESIMHSKFLNNSAAADASLEINSVLFPLIPNMGMNPDPTSNRGNITPLWFKAGDIIRVYSTAVSVFYSIIEYNEK